jgi:hypothetical protein
MENNNVAQEGGWEKTGHSKVDPLAPCNALDQKYQRECYINHGGWLMDLYEHDYVKAIEACLMIPNQFKQPCVKSLALMVTNPAWQPNFLEDTESRTLIENALRICQRFPKEQYELCVIGAVDNLINFDHLDLSRSNEFCRGVDQSVQNLCYRRIGRDLRNITTDHQAGRAICQTLLGKAQAECLSGLLRFN